MERTIKVTGKGNISVRPDTTRMRITLSEVFSSYEKTVEESAKKKKGLTKGLGKLGFDKSELKTLDFRINPEYESYQEKGVWNRRLTGYRYTHSMKLEFPIDNEMLGRVFSTLAKSPGAPEFQVQYTIADPVPVKNELLAKAVDDAGKKAAIIAGAAGVTLKDIVTLDYSWGEVELVSRMYDYGVVNGEEEYDSECEKIELDVEPDDIRTSDTVTVVWEIA